ncbi:MULTISPECIES: septal ring lytic transglycosylase RlpA family protein [unclassified Flavobacterium]|uniref:septal ring lytic transglycosylase RlpA family protein n=1 Tax=unclassified Flavobacterium TaxID=196869 RepID=UPI003F8F9E7B
MKKFITLFFSVAIIGLASSQSTVADKIKTSLQKNATAKDTVKKVKTIIVQQEVEKDTLTEKMGKLVPYKTGSHASYYADKFHGRRTASGAIFDMNKYTAAHKKFPFGTKLRVTNEVNGKSVIVEVIDRGPFVRSREIDLSKRAFMEIAKNKGIGVMTVTIEVFTK